MANIHRGEASFTTSDGETYHLVMDFAALVEAEDAADLDVQSLLKAATPSIDERTGAPRMPKLKYLAALLYGAMQARHPETTYRDAKGLLGEEQAGVALAKALTAATPVQGKSAEGKGVTPLGTGTKPKRAGRGQG